ncbi:MAG: class I tRNA ligase family protein [Promethearchaeota archaeon]
MVANNIPIFNPVDIRGVYTKEAGIFEGKGVFEANDEILKLLENKGTLILTNEIEHEYAHCWRCDSKLVYRATNQWFFKTESLSPELLKMNEEIYWTPDWAGNRWFKSWLTTLKDWCISRQRFWGIPLSVWICDNEECGDLIVIGSAMELKRIAGAVPDDLHRPWIDNVTWKCEKCDQGTKKRIPDILDVWLDSGSVMWAAQEVYDGESHFESWIPADFIIEGKDQIRGWFNSLLSSAIVSSNRKNYLSCYMHGWVLRDKMKMSKSRGGAIFPENLIDGTIKELQQKKSYSNIKGIETFRFYAIGVTQPGRDFNFNVKEYADTYKILNTIWNVYVYANEKFNLANFNPSKIKVDEKSLSKMDKWVISKLHSTMKKVTELADKYHLPWIPGEIRDFIVHDISRWYITLNREKLDVYSDDPHKEQIMSVLFNVLFKFLIMLAPINPMFTEEIYRKMFKSHSTSLGLEETPSIHLQNWPNYDENKIDLELEQQMHFTRDLIEHVRAIKDENKIRLRWPNKRILIEPKEGMPEIIFPDIIKKMANVKYMEIVKSIREKESLIKADSKFYNVYLDISLDPDLLAERVNNDLIRHIQFSRKKNNFKVGEEIQLFLATEEAYLEGYINNNKDSISEIVTAKQIDIIKGELKEDENKVYGKLPICPNQECSATLKDNIYEKLKKNKEVKCPHCNISLSDENIKNITFNFERA